MKKTGICFLASVLLTSASLYAEGVPVLRFSGVLGQSQPVNQKPIEFMGVSGVAFDAHGNMWVARDKKLYQFSKAGDTWSLANTIDLPGQSMPGGLVWNGECLVQVCTDSKVYNINPDTKIVKNVATIHDKDVKSVIVVPNNVKIGFAAKNRIFVLQGNQVLGVNGDTSSVVLTLPLKCGQSTLNYCALGIEPNSGDLLVGSYYPDCKVYRFESSGAEVRKEQWPRAGFLSQIVSLNNQAWGIMGPKLVALPDKSPLDFDKANLGPYPMVACSGLSADPDGNFWIACSQGLLEVTPKDSSVFTRLGGVDGVNHLVVGGRGSLLGTIELGSRIIQLNIDDEAGDPLLSSANEPFRIAGNWKSQTRGMVWVGDKYIVLDTSGKQIWEYHPDYALLHDLPIWVNLTEPGSFSDPKAITTLGELLLVMDGNQLKESKIFAPSKFHTVALPDTLEPVEWMAGTPSGLLVLANTKEIRVYRRLQDVAFVMAGSISGLSISGIAVSGETIFASDNQSASVVVYDANNGDKLGAMDAKEQGGMRPGSLAVSAPWLFVADGNGKRILRFRILTK